jgi:CubicO group peptidase (beta-lactamase class C family)
MIKQLFSIGDFVMSKTFQHIAFCLLIFAGSSFADQDLAEHPRVKEAINLIDIWMQAQLDYDRLTGISVAIVHDQQILWQSSYGKSDMEKQVAAAPDTIYSICSISKLFTALSIMQLRDKGLLNLDDPVKKYLPWFTLERSDPEAPPITIRSVMRHSSGLPRESEFPYWSAPEWPFPEREKIIEMLPNQKTLYSPDTYFQYSNLGISLLGEIVAAVSEQAYEEYVLANLIEPLDLQNTTPYLREDLLGGQMATGYGSWERSGLRQKMKLFDAKGITPAAGFASTAIDLAKFASWHFRTHGTKGDQVLNGYTLKEMLRVQWMDQDFSAPRGLTYRLWRHSDQTFAGHGGSCPGYRTELAMNLKDKIGIVVMFNAMGVNTTNYTNQIYDVIAPALVAAKEDPDMEPTFRDHEHFSGLFTSAWGETAMIPWQGSLAAVDLPTTSPINSITELKHIEGAAYRRLRDDGELGEEIYFVTDKDTTVSGFTWHSNLSRKVK